jgi:hypothetical protein
MHCSLLAHYFILAFADFSLGSGLMNNGRAYIVYDGSPIGCPRHDIPEELAKAKNVQWRQFIFWLERRSADELAAADAEALAFSYAPLAQWEIEQVIGVRIKALRRRK